MNILRTILVLTSLGCCLAAEVPGEYKSDELARQLLGVDDVLKIAVYGAPEMSQAVRVDRNGTIGVSVLSQRIPASGRTVADLERSIATALTDEGLLVKPAVSVLVDEWNSRPVTVAGAVNHPASFQAVRPVTLLEAITRAGGLRSEAGNEIILRAKAADGANTTTVIRVTRLLDEVSLASNPLLTGGEEVRVPESGKVFVLGNVRRPGAYRLDMGRKGSVLSLIALAEGLAPNSRDTAYVFRSEAGVRHEVPIPIGRILARKTGDVDLQADDILYIPDNRFRKATLSIIEKAVGVGGGVSSALVYGAAR